jgi:flagellar motor switch protein FliM
VPHDFRRPGKLSRDILRVLELGHESFVRRLASTWGGELRAAVQIEPLGVDQTSYDDHVRAMPSPNVVMTVPVAPLPGAVVVDCDVQLALRLVERLLGAGSMPGIAAPRRPSDVETDLIAFLGRQAAHALTGALDPLVDGELEASMAAVEYNPQLVQVAAPSDTTLVLSYRVAVSGGLEASGLLTVAYPAPVLHPLLELIAARREIDPDAAVDEVARHAMKAGVADVPVSLGVQFDPTLVFATDLAALRVGDVLRLDHRVDVPLRGVVGDQEVVRAHVGRRGRRLAIQVRNWSVIEPAQLGSSAQVVAPSVDRAHDMPATDERPGSTG